MTSARHCRFALAFCLVGASLLPALAQTANQSQQTFRQYLSDLQSNVDNRELRERIIKLAATLYPRPSAPAEARRHMVRGQAAFESAKGSSDYQKAVGEFQQAVDLAPWWGEAYYNLALAQDKAGSYAAATSNIKLYLLTEPPDADAAAAKDLMYKIEYRQEEAQSQAAERARISAQQAEAERQRRERTAFLDGLNGVRYLHRNDAQEDRITIRGNELVVEYRAAQIDTSWREFYRVPINGRQGIHRIAETCRPPTSNCDTTYTIDEDGGAIIEHIWSAYGWQNNVYRRQY